MKAFLIAVALSAGLAATPAQAALFNFRITGGFSGMGTFTTSDTVSASIPGGYLITAMTGTFNGATISGIRPPGTLYADNMFFTDGLHVDEDGWTFRAGSRDYNMFLSEITDASGTYNQLLIGYPGINGGSKRVALAVTPVSAVPEPAMIGLFGLGAIALGLGRRRRA